MESGALEDMRLRYGSSTARRQELFARFENWLTVAQSTGALRRVWIYGSYITDKPWPQDLDVLALFSADVDVGKLSAEAADWLDEEACRNRFGIDFNYVTELLPRDAVDGLLEWLSQGRTRRQGIVEVEL